MDFLGYLESDSERSSLVEVCPGYLVTQEADDKKIEMTEKTEEE